MIGQLTNDQIQRVLKANALGRIACREDNKLYIVPVNYIYEDNSIIVHSNEGMKTRMMRKNPAVCFEVDEMKSFTNWKSVIAWGEYHELTEEKEKYQAMKLFVDRMMRLKISDTAKPPEITAERTHPRSPGNIKPVVFRILISEITGRFETDGI
jgi:nitroimidazol reductase NimA-like FMN-containing flavoprotein (pyridoxamine 5'-phosphate oxidase superfamily)